MSETMENRPFLTRINSLILPGLALLIALYLISREDYLLFHGIVEISSIVVAFAIFMFSWNARRFLDNNYLLFIGIAFLFVAFFDMLHTLAYPGMGVFKGGDTNLAAQLWVSARFLQSSALLLAPFFLYRKLRVGLLFAAYSLVSALLLASIFYWQDFPVCFVDGVGLTPFKIASEELISVFMLVSVALLWRQRQRFDQGVLSVLIMAIGFLVLGELAFTRYPDAEAPANMIGHFLKFVSFFLFYKAIIETGLVKPVDVLFHNLKKNEEALTRHTAELQIRNEELDAFAHTVAHDLNSPLSAIVSAVDALEQPDLPPELQREFVQGLKDTVVKMGHIIDDLLLLSQVRKMDVPVEPLDMKSLRENTQQRLSQMIRDSQAEIHFPAEWPAAMGYGPWVEEVLVNYLSNAIKYGGKPPCVEVGASPEPDGKVRFWVRDNGPGIPQEDQPRLFRPFSQLGRLNGKGHGLGLSIVRRIVEKLGGQVGVESEPGRGSVFFFTLPGMRMNPEGSRG